MADPEKNVNVLELRRNFNQFKSLDSKKLEIPLTRMEEIRWSELHSYLIKALFGSAYSMLLDQRDYIRVPLKIDLVYRFEGKKYYGTTKDLSVYGTCLQYNPSLYIGAKVKLFFEMKSKGIFRRKKRISLDAKIVWMNTEIHLMGIEFYNIVPEAKSFLSDAIYSFLEEKITDRTY